MRNLNHSRKFAKTFPAHCTGDKPMLLPTPGNLSGRFSTPKKATIAMNWIRARLRCKCGRPSFFLRSSATVCLVGLEKGPIAANVMSIPTNEI